MKIKSSSLPFLDENTKKFVNQGGCYLYHMNDGSYVLLLNEKAFFLTNSGEVLKIEEKDNVEDPSTIGELTLFEDIEFPPSTNMLRNKCA